MRIGVLTSSRADFGIYQPLLSELKKRNVDLHILAFGMHVMDQYGKTVNQIKEGNYGHMHELSSLLKDDSAIGINQSYANVISSFGEFWKEHSFDRVIALGDRFEMSAAVQSTIPFEITVCHIHGGEETLGATDNIYRHQITLAATMHFAAAEVFSDKIKSLKPEDASKTFNVGALSLDNLNSLELPAWKVVCEKFKIPSKPFILITVHPETVGLENNKTHITEFINAAKQLMHKWHLVITMPNADASGLLYRNAFIALKKEFPNQVSIIETFGKLNYFSAMKNAHFLLGNTSSGIIEAASFGKFVINIGDRQKGRLRSENVFDINYNSQAIIESASEINTQPIFEGINVYHKQNTAVAIAEKLLDEKL